MRIWNAKNPIAAALLVPWLIPTQTESRMQIAAELYQRLKEKPDDTFCAIAIERDIARGVLIAHVSDCSPKTCWLWQANSQCGFRFSGLMFDGLKMWAKNKRLKEIRIASKRKAQSIQRRWGFEAATNDEMVLKLGE